MVVFFWIFPHKLGIEDNNQHGKLSVMNGDMLFRVVDNEDIALLNGIGFVFYDIVSGSLFNIIDFQAIVAMNESLPAIGLKHDKAEGIFKSEVFLNVLH